MRTIELINKNILVLLDQREEVSEGGIHIPEKHREANVWGEVVAISDDCKLGLKVGDRVHLPMSAGTHYIPRTGQEGVIVDEGRVLLRAA